MWNRQLSDPQTWAPCSSKDGESPSSLGLFFCLSPIIVIFITFFPIISNSNSVCCNSELWVSPNCYALQRQTWLHLLCEVEIQKTSKWFYILKYLVCKNSSNDWIIFIKPVISFGLSSSTAWIVSEKYKNIK